MSSWLVVQEKCIAANSIYSAQMSDIIWRPVKKAQQPAVKEPVMELSRSDGKKRPEVAMLMSWTRGALLARDIVIPDTFAYSYIGNTSRRVTAASDTADSNKTSKYIELIKTHHFIYIAIDTGGVCNESALEFITELGRIVTGVTHDSRETIPLQAVVHFFAEREC